MKLLLDVHHSRHAAARLRERGYDVVAAADSTVLAQLADDELIRAAKADGRVIVTENVDDFARVAHELVEAGEHHAGIVLTSRRRYDRRHKSYPQSLVRALAKFLDDAPDKQVDGIWWL